MLVPNSKFSGRLACIQLEIIWIGWALSYGVLGLKTCLALNYLMNGLVQCKKTRPGKEKDRWWTFGKVGPIGCLHSSDETEEERNEVKGWIGLDKHRLCLNKDKKWEIDRK